MLNDPPACADDAPTLHRTAERRRPPVEWLSDGGLAPDTELLTTDGPTPVADCLPGDRVLALDTTTGLARAKPLLAVEAVETREAVDVDARRVGFRVRPAQRLLLHTAGGDRVRTIRADNLDAYSYYKFVNDWERVARRRLETVDITEVLDEYEVCAAVDDHGHTFRAALPDGCEAVRTNSHTGYHFGAETFEAFRGAIEQTADEVHVRSGRHARRRPYRFDADDFLRLLGWYVTEGSCTESTTSDTVEVRIAQDPGPDHDAIAALCRRMGLDPSVDDRSIRFSARLFGRLFTRLCGAESRAKRLPPLVHDLPTDQQELLLNVLVRGDGNDNGIFYTSSDRLASDVLRLCGAVGVSPRYSRRDEMWRLSIRRTNDGLDPDAHVRQVDADHEYYRVAVADHPVVLAGRDGKFQWVGASGTG